MAEAKVITDSISPNGDRLITVETKFWRPMLPEVNTHRVFCLAGDAILSFEGYGLKVAPSGLTQMTIAEFVKRWKEDSSILSKMRIRQVNETTMEVQTSTVADCIESGEKEVYVVRLESGRSVAGSKDHRVLTSGGWKAIKDLVVGEDECVYRPEASRFSNTPFVSRTKAKETAKTSPVASVELRNIEQTYDLTIDGEFPNFLANDIVVHNSRNSASSRARPLIKKLSPISEVNILGTLQEAIECPVYPSYWLQEKPGMSGGDTLSEEDERRARKLFVDANKSVTGLIEEYLEEVKSKWGDNHREHTLHKSAINRLIEPYLSHTAVITSTEWANFFDQRIHPDAQGEMYDIAVAIRHAIDTSTPKKIGYGEFHLPYIRPSEVKLSTSDKIRLSVARCARTSFLNHNGTTSIKADLGLFDRLIQDKHYSPTEHIATPARKPFWRKSKFHANFRGWKQVRHIRKELKL